MNEFLGQPRFPHNPAGAGRGGDAWVECGANLYASGTDARRPPKDP